MSSAWRVVGSSRSAVVWPLLVLALSIVPVLGVFTTHRIFFVRDLSLFFWSRHLWLRQTLFGGSAPWWDPFVAGGQSAIADALNQLLMPVTVAIRLLPSDVVAFNLWIALPLPIAALGTFWFLRQRVPPAAAALGACAFALSGPVVSMLNTPNLSWSVALMPWVLAAASLSSRSPVLGPRFSMVAALFALQALCGEPVTWAATGVLAMAYSRKVNVILALFAGTLLAAAQLVPTMMAGMRAQRGTVATPDFWSLHPVSLWETVAPNIFGNYYDAFLADLPWMGALNFGRDPFFYSLYVGPFVLLLVLVGVAARFRRNVFWACVAVAFLAAALGGYTPLYPFLRTLVPPLMYFRFPVKYLVFAVFACAVLAAEGWASITNLPPQGGSHEKDEKERGRSDRILWLPPLGGSVTVLAALGLLLSIAALALPDMMTRAAHWLAAATHLKDPAAGAAFLAPVAPPLLVRLFSLLLAGCALLWYARLRPTRQAPAVLFIALCADLVATNARLNPTMDIAKLAPPAWYTASEGAQRLYIGGRMRGFMNTSDPDATGSWQIPAETTAIEGRMVLNAELPMAPSGYRVREAVSYDLPYLWPAEYEAAVTRFERAGPAQRLAFLRRSGVRRCVRPPLRPDSAEAASGKQGYGGQAPWQIVGEAPGWNMRVFDCHPAATRLFLATEAGVSREPADLAWQREALFDPALPDTVARVSALPAVAGRAGTPESPFLRIVEDGSTRVVVEAALREPGLLVLRDSFDPSWRADVDGVTAEVARANGLYRAVSLPAGRHVIRFSYRPRDFIAGLTISGMTLLAFIGFIGFNRFRFGRFNRFRFGRFNRFGSTRTRNRNPLNPMNPMKPPGFTLVELMIVLAIVAVLLAIAFNEYRGMQARGNDASAVGSLRSIAAAQWQFALTCGNMKYATTLPALARPVPATGQGFLSPDLTAAETFEKSGYQFQMAAKPIDGAPPACNGATVAEGYAATADPVKPGFTGNYYYGVNADRVLYLDEAQTFTGNLAESGAAGHGGEVR